MNVKQTERPSPPFWLRAYASYRWIHHRLERMTWLMNTCVGDVLFGTLSPTEKDALISNSYCSSPHVVGSGRKQLFSWEKAWFDEVLPNAPARILIGAAGWGREVGALRRMGYDVVGFEPAVATTQDKDARLSRIVEADYRDFSECVGSGNGAAALKEICQQSYDAVILGWGSLSHVCCPEERRRVLEAAFSLVPKGVVCASFFSPPLMPSIKRGQRRRQLFEIGRTLGKWRGMAGSLEEDFIFSPHFGFGVIIRQAEVEAVAMDCGRKLEFHSEPYPHATFLPPN